MKKRMSIILCLSLVVALIPAFFVQANAAQVKFTYTLSEDGQYYIITKIKPDDDYANIELGLPSFYNSLPVRMIAANALDENADEYIDSIFLHTGITFVDESNFENSGIMFTAASDNEYYSSQDGVLYNKDMTILYKCPTTYENAVFVVPDTVEVINDYALYRIGRKVYSSKVSKVDEVVIPESVKEIGDYAFYFSLLDKVTFSEGLETLFYRIL